MNAQNVCILGSTGSIGDSTLDVIARNPDHFNVVALTAHRNTEKLARQCAQFDADIAVVADPARAPELSAQLRAAGARAEALLSLIHI